MHVHFLQLLYFLQKFKTNSKAQVKLPKRKDELYYVCVNKINLVVNFNFITEMFHLIIACQKDSNN